MWPRISALITCTICFVPVAQGAFADECSPLKIISSVNLKTEPPDSRYYVPVELQGQHKYMLLDTGGAFSEITPDAVTSLGLATHRSIVGAYEFRTYDISGNFTDHVAVVPSFAIGALSGEHVEFMVRSGPMPAGGSEVAGVLAPNILSYYDVSIDFAASKLTLLSQDHCAGKVIYWPAAALAVIPMNLTKASGHIHVPVTLDGRQLNAEIDTGAYNTALNRNVAEDEFRLDPKQSGMSPIGQMNNRNHDVVYRHSFKLLSFNGIAVSNPSIDIIPDLLRGQMDRPPPIGTRLKQSDSETSFPDLLIGMDVLRHLHLYVAYKEHKLYVTPSVEPVAASPAPMSEESSASAPPAKGLH